MKKLFFLVLFAALLSIQNVMATDYYFSSINGSDSNNGLSSSTPKLSESAMQTVMNSLSAGDNVYLECGSVWYDIDLSIDQKNGSSGSPITITSYGSGDLPKLISMKELGTFTDQGSNIWSITDTQLPTTYRNTFKNDHGDINWYYNDLSFLIIDGEPYAMGKHPNDNTYYQFENVASDDESWAQDTDAPWSDDYWNGAHAKIGTHDWIVEDLRITDYGSGTFYFNTSDYVLSWPKLSMHNNINRYLKYYITNHVNTLDLNGEWCYDNPNQNIKVYWSGNLNNSDVYQSYANHCLEIDSCSFINVSEIEFQGSVRHTVLFQSCQNSTFSNCIIHNSPRFALWIDECVNVTVSDNLITQGVSMGIINTHGTNITIEDNIVRNMGWNASMGGDTDGDNRIGIKDDRRRGITTIRRNTIDSTGYSGINVTGLYDEVYHATTNDAHLYIEDNNISNYCNVTTDGGGIYVWMDKYAPANTVKSISDNIIYHGISNVGLTADGSSFTMGVYLDGQCYDFDVTSNSIYETNTGIFLHGTSYSKLNRNNIYDIGYTKGRRSGFVGNSSGYGHDAPDSYAQIYSNQIVVRDTISACGNWLYTTFNANGSTCDSNYYYNPYITDGLPMMKTISWNAIRISFTEWKSITGFDSNSTYNNNGESYSCSLGISEDQFVKFLINRDQASSRIVDLHSCTFEDIDGASVSGSVSIPARSSKFLFYKSGNADSLALIVPDPDFIPSDPTSYALAINISGSGTVSPSSGSYPIDTTLLLTATPSTGYEFTGWSGDTITTTNPLYVNMWKNKTITATFTDTTSSSNSDLIAYWPFEEGTGTSTEDITDNNYDGTLNNGAAFDGDSEVGSYSVAFDGGNDYISTSSIDVGSAFTISAWVKIPNTVYDIQTIIANVSSGSTSNGFKLFVNTYGTNNGRIILETGNGSSSDQAYSAINTFDFGQWNHVAIVVDKAAGTALIYYNGDDVTDDGSIRTDFSTSATVHLAQMTNSSYTMEGNLDDFRIYDYKLSSSEVDALANGTSLPIVTIIATDATATESDTTTGTYRISRGTESSGDLTVNFSASGTATITSDYTLSSTSSVTISDGNTYVDITLTPIDDASVESIETAILSLTTGTGYTIGSPSGATVTISDNDQPAHIYVTGFITAWVFEENESVAYCTISRLPGETSGDLTVYYSLTGSATLYDDFTISPADSVIISDGNTSATVTLTAVDDTLTEVTEFVSLYIAPGTGYTYDVQNYVPFSVIDDEIQTVNVILFDANSTEENETTAAYRFTRGVSTSGDLSVNYSVSGTATLNTDYTLSSSGSVTISDGTCYTDVILTPIDDAIVEGMEYVTITLTSGTGYLIGNAIDETVGITDNDVASQDTIAKINFTFNGYTETGWTSVYGSSSSPVNLGDGITMTISGNTLCTGQAGEPSTILPGNVGLTYSYLSNAYNTDSYLNISGLDTSNTYSFVFFESRDDASASGDRTTTYTIGASSVSLNPIGNSDSLLTISGVETDGSGEVDVAISKIDNQYGYINAMIVIDEGLKKAKIKSKQISDEFQKISYFPVPVTNKMNLRNIPERSIISVYSVTGKKVIEKMTGNNTSMQIDMSALEAGVYVFKVVSDELTLIDTFKVVKN